MKVRAINICFIDGSRRRPGDVFEWSGKLSADLEEVKENEPAPEVETENDGNPMSDSELRVRLAEYGVRTRRDAPREMLLAKLAEAEGR